MFEITVPTAVLLAMSCVAEISFQKDPKECVVMWEINQRNAELKNRSLRKQTLLYNAYWRSTPQRARRPWIQHLRGGEEPKHWPKRLKWKFHRHLWLNYVKAAREFLRTVKTRKPICPSALDYGAPKEYPAEYMERIVCTGNTLQWYWARKSKDDINKLKKGILPKRAIDNKGVISESILSQKRRAAKSQGANE